MNLIFKLFFVTAIGIGCPFLQAQSPESLKKNSEAVRNQMQEMSRQLGVTCTACHVSSNFSSSEKNEFSIALKHIKLTQLLIDHGFDGKNGQPKADCYMCHRGKIKPDYREKIDPLLYKNLKK